MLLNFLEEIATDKIKTLGAVDEVEVHLGFLCRLKNAIDLPINLENMLYFDISYIKEKKILKTQRQRLKRNSNLKKQSLIF